MKRGVENMIGVGIAMSATLTGCSEQPQPDAILAVDCENGPTIDELYYDRVSDDADSIKVELRDPERKIVTEIKRIGALAIDNHIFSPGDAGQVVKRFENTELRLGSLVEGRYVDGDEALTFVCTDPST